MVYVCRACASVYRPLFLLQYIECCCILVAIFRPEVLELFGVVCPWALRGVSTASFVPCLPFNLASTSKHVFMSRNNNSYFFASLILDIAKSSCEEVVQLWAFCEVVARFSTSFRRIKLRLASAGVNEGVSFGTCSIVCRLWVEISLGFARLDPIERRPLADAPVRTSRGLAEKLPKTFCFSNPKNKSASEFSWLDRVFRRICSVNMCDVSKQDFKWISLFANWTAKRFWKDIFHVRWPCVLKGKQCLLWLVTSASPSFNLTALSDVTYWWRHARECADVDFASRVSIHVKDDCVPAFVFNRLSDIKFHFVDNFRLFQMIEVFVLFYGPLLLRCSELWRYSSQCDVFRSSIQVNIVISF